VAESTQNAALRQVRLKWVFWSTQLMSVILSTEHGCVGRDHSGLCCVWPLLPLVFPVPAGVGSFRAHVIKLTTWARRFHLVHSSLASTPTSWIRLQHHHLHLHTSLSSPPTHACYLLLTTSSAVRQHARAKAWGFTSRRSFTKPHHTVLFPFPAPPSPRVPSVCTPGLVCTNLEPTCTRSPTSPARLAMAGRR
jgi:hypothetical protein